MCERECVHARVPVHARVCMCNPEAGQISLDSFIREEERVNIALGQKLQITTVIQFHILFSDWNRKSEFTKSMATSLIPEDLLIHLQYHTLHSSCPQGHSD